MRNLLQKSDGRDLTKRPRRTDKTTSHDECANILCKSIHEGSHDENHRADGQ